jgi:cytochrome P450
VCAATPSQALTDQELLDQINTFLFVGSDSTGVAIAWCLHYLSLHSSVQATLRDELLTLPATADAETRADSIGNLHFLDYVAKETLRLCPPVFSTIRMPTRDDDIPLSEPLVLRDGRRTSTVKIRKGSMVDIPLEGFNISVDIWGPSATKFE